jgi:hypothetical protein
MRARLEFDLPEDQDQLTLAQHGYQWWQVAWDMDTWLRNLIKYGTEYKTADEALQACRDRLREFIDAQGVDLEEVS